jgi:archaellum component FlaG (FlaF/FlaG flagellin family)
MLLNADKKRGLFEMRRLINLTAHFFNFAAGILLIAALIFCTSSLRAESDDNAVIAKSLADMLRAGRQVISNNQSRINDPNIGDKGLSGQVVLQQAVEIFKKNTGMDPASIDPASRLGKLLHAQMDAIVEATDANQATMNVKGVGFKAFIPAVFARLVNEAFESRAKDQAQVKVTAPENLVRNRKSRPDQWEAEVIRGKLLQADWPRGHEYSAIVDSKGKSAFRMMMPEYYASSCLSCHGSPKGETDITGYPKEGGKEGDLGAIISVTLFK